MNEETKRVEDSFESGYLWELYMDLERQFENFLEYVPYIDENESVHSFKLLNLITSIGGYVDSAFKEMARYPRFSDNKDCHEIIRRLTESKENIEKDLPPNYPGIRLCLQAFEKECQLSSRRLVFKKLEGRQIITPFKPCNPKTKAPDWWDIYNGLKHNLGVNFKEANLKNTLNALGGAFLLNVTHEPSILRLFKYGVLKVEHSVSHGSPLEAISLSEPFLPTKDHEKALQWMLENKKEFKGIVETPLFLCCYREVDWHEYMW